MAFRGPRKTILSPIAHVTEMATPPAMEAVEASNTASAFGSTLYQPQELGTYGADLFAAGTRLDAVTYQNTSGKKRRVTVYINGAVAGKMECAFQADSFSPPTTTRQNVGVQVDAAVGQTHSDAVVFEVPKDWYYKVGLAIGTVGKWFELDE